VISDDIVEADLRLHTLQSRVAQLIHDTIGVTMRVSLLAPGEAPRSEGGKLNRVVDRRPKT
jgi:phenylacetate-CoA ligase